jgi:hypothetical protein
MTEIELGTAEKENFQTPRAALAQHPRTTSLPTANCLHEDFAVSGQTGDESIFCCWIASDTRIPTLLHRRHKYFGLRKVLSQEQFNQLCS